MAESEGRKIGDRPEKMDEQSEYGRYLSKELDQVMRGDNRT